MVVAVAAMVLTLLAGVGARQAAASSTCHPYPDVSASNPHCENIAWLKGQDITKPADGRYHPLSSVNRGSMAAFLFRLTHPGKPQPACTRKPFPDVSTGSTFCGYITWAKNNGIAYGYPDGSYGPDKAVTRGAMAAYLSRIANAATHHCTSKPYSDVATSDTFCPVITWMKREKITYGSGGGKYGTTSPVTRQAMASFLRRIADGPLALMGTYFTGSQIFNTYSSDDNYYGVWFVDNQWAYWGRPEHGTPHCSKTTVTVTKKDLPSKGEGCLSYRLDATSGSLRVGPLSGRYRNGTLTINGHEYQKVRIPRAGARYTVNLQHLGWSGQCLGLHPFGSCTTWTDGLVLRSDGKFVLAHSSISGWPGNGGWTGTWPPDERGTYRVASNARIVLSFANGKTSVRTFAVRLNPHGKPDPTDSSGHGGLILGADTYWDSTD